MTIDADGRDERSARIEQILEELRLNTEDMWELARQASERAFTQRAQARTKLTHAREGLHRQDPTRKRKRRT